MILYCKCGQPQFFKDDSGATTFTCYPCFKADDAKAWLEQAERAVDAAWWINR